MRLWIPKNLKELKQRISSPLYENSLFIILVPILRLPFIFILWMFASMLCPGDGVRISTAVILSMALIESLPRFGLNRSTIRFFSDRDDDRFFSNSVIITLPPAMLSEFISVAYIDLWSPKLDIMKGYIPFPTYSIVVGQINYHSLMCLLVKIGEI